MWDRDCPVLQPGNGVQPGKLPSGKARPRKKSVAGTRPTGCFIPTHGCGWMSGAQS